MPSTSSYFKRYEGSINVGDKVCLQPALILEGMKEALMWVIKYAMFAIY